MVECNIDLFCLGNGVYVVTYKHISIINVGKVSTIHATVLSNTELLYFQEHVLLLFVLLLYLGHNSEIKE